MKKQFFLGAAIGFAALFLISGFMLCRLSWDAKTSAQNFDEVAQLVTAPPKLPVSSQPEDEKEEPVRPSAYEQYAGAYEKNSDFVGWVSIEDTRIDYPVMQTKDRPDYYLKRNFEKQYSDYGVPYAAESCDIDLSDNIVVYGHHMNDGSMFADLCLYESEDFYKEHKIIRFDTLGGYGTYEIIAAFKTVAYSEDGFKYYRFVQANDEAEFDAFIGQCKELSLYDTGVTAEYGDKLLTLSTCEYSRKNGRMVVVAKKVSE